VKSKSAADAARSARRLRAALVSALALGLR
jgi:hypothetical protein